MNLKSNVRHLLPSAHILGQQLSEYSTRHTSTLRSICWPSLRAKPAGRLSTHTKGLCIYYFREFMGVME